MFDTLEKLATRPTPFCAYTAEDLWTRPHIAKQMLKLHLDGSNDLASRNADSIASITQWLHHRFSLTNKALCDLGCGPGLYAHALASLGAHVTGLDFSESSLSHARAATQDLIPRPRFIKGNYLEDDLPADQDLVVLIYGDFCALAPSQRKLLLSKIRDQLKVGGSFVFDVFSDKVFAACREDLSIEKDLMGSFWAPSPYMGVKKSWRYDDRSLALDHYLIASPSEQFEIYNWMQYYTPSTLAKELEMLGFTEFEFVDILSGVPIDDQSYGDHFAAIVTP